MIKSSLAAAGVASVSPELVGRMAAEGVLFHGLEILGGGAALGGLVLGAMAVYIIDRRFWAAAGFAGGGAVLTFFGLMHGERVGFGQSPAVAASYLMVALFLAGCAKFTPAPATPAPVPRPADQALAGVA
jgi:AGZA family xanthine/uracil permease-like MFS transporter